jgi:aspartate/methionine/tyrosine aminotransferase
MAACSLARSLARLCARSLAHAQVYFNHRMALQSCGRLLEGEWDRATLRPDLDWLERKLSAQQRGARAGPRISVVTLVNPNNPTGVLLSRAELERACELTRRAGVWLLVDNTYCEMVYEGGSHHCPRGAHVVHVFSFSKSFGLMGWRVGYLALPPGDLLDEVVKLQDTVAICATQLSQTVALAALEGDGSPGEAPEAFGADYVRAQVRALGPNRAAVRAALESALGAASVVGGQGAIYFFARLPPAFAAPGLDVEVVRWLVVRKGVCVIPGSACSAPGWLRVAFANLPPADCARAAARLQEGLHELVKRGPAALETNALSSR